MNRITNYHNIKILIAFIFFGLFLTACENENMITNTSSDELSTPLELRDAGCFSIVRDFCAPGECCTYTACSDYTYQGGNAYTMVSNSPASSIIQHPLVIDEPICWTIITCESGSFTMMAGPYPACTQFVKCGGCPVTTTFSAEHTNNLQNDHPNLSDCCIFTFDILPHSIPGDCSFEVITGPRGGVAQNDLSGRIRLCPDEDVELVLT